MGTSLSFQNVPSKPVPFRSVPFQTVPFKPVFFKVLGVLAASVLMSLVPPMQMSERSPTNTDTASPVWRHPVEAPIVDFFRPPANPYGPGNRGLEYGTTEGEPVVAVAAGKVVFAGQVGGNLFVVIAHGPKLRSTYAYLREVTVSAGELVSQGASVATAKPGFHLTARLNGRYVDPLRFMALRLSVRLVAVDASLVGASTLFGPR